jgi:hypothetical protein
VKKLVYAQGGIELMSLGISTQLCELLPLYFLYSSTPPPPSLCGINKNQLSYEGQEGAHSASFGSKRRAHGHARAAKTQQYTAGDSRWVCWTPSVSGEEGNPVKCTPLVPICHLNSTLALWRFYFWRSGGSTFRRGHPSLLLWYFHTIITSVDLLVSQVSRARRQ